MLLPYCALYQFAFGETHLRVLHAVIHFLHFFQAGERHFDNKL